MYIKPLTDDEVYHAIETGEFSVKVIHSRARVAVVMTQDWCTQWMSMRSWLDSLDESSEIDVYEVIYNTARYFSDVLDLKENRWGNASIPYVRYYVDGRLVRESNYVTKDTFLAYLGL